MAATPMRIAGLGLLCAVVWLAGCASTRLDTNVHTIGVWPDGRAPGRFAFERLPSQQGQPAEQDRLEAAALPALAQAGFAPAGSEPPDVRVQVAERQMQVQGVVPDPFINPYWVANPVMAGRWRGPVWGPGWGWGVGAAYAVPFYLVEVSVLVIDARSKLPLYESRAQTDGGWPDERTRTALFAAALRDFPYTAVSPRRVTVELPAN